MNKLQAFSAVLKFINGSNIGKDYVQGVYDYITDPVKTDNGKLISARGCSEDDPLRDILLTKKLYNKTGGKQIEHLIFAFPPGASGKKPEEMLGVATKILDTAFPDFQSISAFHTDSKAPHVHNILSSVNAVTGKKFSQSPSDLNRLKQKVNDILHENGFEIIEASANDFIDHTDHSEEEGFDFLELDESEFITESMLEEISSGTGSVDIINTSTYSGGWGFGGWNSGSCCNITGGYNMYQNNLNNMNQPQAVPQYVQAVENVPSVMPMTQQPQELPAPTAEVENVSPYVPTVEAVSAEISPAGNNYPNTNLVIGPTFRIQGDENSNFAGLNTLVQQTTAYAQEHQQDYANLSLAMQECGQKRGYPSNVSLYAGPIFDINLLGGSGFGNNGWG